MAVHTFKGNEISMSNWCPHSHVHVSIIHNNHDKKSD
jgi:hypothetical protein